jgi:spore maturation protein SpmA
MPVGYLRCVLIGTLAGFFAYLVQSFFDTTFYSVQLSMLLWIMMALAVAVQKIFRNQQV